MQWENGSLYHGRSLKHFGRLGMKWGQHIFQQKNNVSGIVASAGAIKKTADGNMKNEGNKGTTKKEKKIRKAAIRYKTKRMSDDEIRKKIARSKLVNEYMQARKDDYTKEVPVKNKKRLSKFLSVSAGVVGTAASAALIWGNYTEIKKTWDDFKKTDTAKSAMKTTVKAAKEASPHIDNIVNKTKRIIKI